MSMYLARLASGAGRLSKKVTKNHSEDKSSSSAAINTINSSANNTLLGSTKKSQNTTSTLPTSQSSTISKSSSQLNQSLCLSPTSSNQNQNIANSNSNSSSKTVDKLLEEASLTSELNLSGKQLKEFPRISQFYNLADTVSADISHNQLSEFPKELCSLIALETLTLYTNHIRSIPDSVCKLRCLRVLNLSCNSLCYLPPSICTLQSLEVLIVNNNKLVSLPEEIFKLDKLIELDVSCNEITHLPVQIGDMISLRCLNVRRNLLVELPKEISKCKLVSFDCSCNRITKLPLCFREIITLIDLNVDSNPLEVPPAALCTKGLLHIMKYLLNETIKEEKKRGILSEYEINRQYRNSIAYQSTRKLSHMSKIKRKAVSSVDSGYQTTTDASVHKNGVTNSPNSSANQLNSLSDLLASSELITTKDLSSIGHFQALNNSIKSNNDYVEKPHVHALGMNNHLSAPILIDYQTPNADKYYEIERQTQQQTRELSKKMHEEQLALLEKQRHFHQQQFATNNPNIQNSSHYHHNLNHSAINTHNTNNNNNNHTKPHLRRLTTDCYYYEKTNSNSSNSLTSKSIFSASNTNASAGVNMSTPAARNVYEKRSYNSATSLRTLATGVHAFSALLDNRCEPSEFEASVIMAATNADMNVLVNRNGSTSSSSSPSYQDFHQNANSTTNHELANQKNISISYFDNTNEMSCNEVIFNNPPNDSPDYSQAAKIVNRNNMELSNQQNKVLSSPLSLNNSPISSMSNNSPKMMHQKSPANGQSMNDPNPAFTIRRHIYQVQEESKQVELLKKTIESKLKITLPEDIGSALSDGVVLCHLMNQMVPRAIQIIHVPSLAVPKLSLAKCRKNVENFIEACLRIGFPETELCTTQDIIESKNTPRVARTVAMLVSFNQQQYQSNQDPQSPKSPVCIAQQQQQSQFTSPKQEQQTAV